jgi:Serine acetyltransferase, N-terminal
VRCSVSFPLLVQFVARLLSPSRFACLAWMSSSLAKSPHASRFLFRDTVLLTSTFRHYEPNRTDVLDAPTTFEVALLGPVSIPLYDLGIGKNPPVLCKRFHALYSEAETTLPGPPQLSPFVVVETLAERTRANDARESMSVERGGRPGLEWSRTGRLIKPPYPVAFYPDIDLSIPSSVFDPSQGVDLVWDLLRWEAYEAAQQEPVLVSFLYSTILNHPGKLLDHVNRTWPHRPVL